LHAAQVIPQIDAEIAKKGRFWMETSYSRGNNREKIVRCQGQLMPPSMSPVSVILLPCPRFNPA
jgi:hypothetical protein